MRRLPPLKPQIFQDIIFVASWLTGSHGRFKNGFYPICVAWMRKFETISWTFESCQNNLSFMKYLKDGNKIQRGWQSSEFISVKIKPDITPDILHKFPIVKRERVITDIHFNRQLHSTQAVFTRSCVWNVTPINSEYYKESENNKSR